MKCSSRAVTHPADATLRHPLFAARKEGWKCFRTNLSQTNPKALFPTKSKRGQRQRSEPRVSCRRHAIVLPVSRNASFAAQGLCPAKPIIPIAIGTRGRTSFAPFRSLLPRASANEVNAPCHYAQASSFTAFRPEAPRLTVLRTDPCCRRL